MPLKFIKATLNPWRGSMFSNLLGNSVNLQHPSLTTSKAIGEWSERLDCGWFESHGLKLLERNYLSKYGEID
jgi:hypothetical protein